MVIVIVVVIVIVGGAIASFRGVITALTVGGCNGLIGSSIGGWLR